MHLLGHLFIPLLLFLRGSAVLDSLNVRLQAVHQHPQCGNCASKDAGLGLLTCLSASFSSFNSFSCSLMASCCLRASTLFAYDVNPALGRKGFLLLCQFFPAGLRRCIVSQEGKGKADEKKKWGEETWTPTVFAY